MRLKRSAIRTVVAVTLVGAIAPTVHAQSVTVGNPLNNWFQQGAPDGGSVFQDNSSDPNNPDGDRITRVFEVGQTFRAPNDWATLLSSFTVYPTTEMLPLPYTCPSSPCLMQDAFQLQIIQWDGTQAVGDALYVSAPTYATTSDWAGSPITFQTDLSLDPAAMYVAFISPIDPGAGTTVDGQRLFVYSGGYTNSGDGTDPYADGSEVYHVQQYFNGEPDAKFPTGAGAFAPYNSLPDSDLRFSATFNAPPVTATPEPASMTLMATGMFGVAGWAKRRRVRSAV